MSSLHRVMASGRQWLVLRRQPLLRPLSSMAMNGATNGATPILPTVHSRKTLPPACTDAQELEELTQHVLSTEVGNLFQFDQATFELDRNDRAKAWEQADGTVQMVEYLMRGYSAQIPGTLWHEWTKEENNISSGEDPLVNLETLGALLMRMTMEGKFYMGVRKDHFSQVAYEKTLDADEDTVEDDWKSFAKDETTAEDAKEEEKNEEGDEASATDGKEGEAKQEGDEDGGVDDTTEDFALPGPTVAMHDILLDTMAVTAATAGDPQTFPTTVTAETGEDPEMFASRPASELLTARCLLTLLENIEHRHRSDGGEMENDNIHTLPTPWTYNAMMRTCANLYYPEDGTNEVLRDSALIVAFHANDLLHQSQGLHRTPSTFVYLMQVLAKYMPACESRGNMVHGLFEMAKEEGVLNDQVLEAYLKANQPSNGPRADEWIEANLRGKTENDIPGGWRRRAKHRMTDIPWQTTY